MTSSIFYGSGSLNLPPIANKLNFIDLQCIAHSATITQIDARIDKRNFVEGEQLDLPHIEFEFVNETKEEN